MVLIVLMNRCYTLLLLMIRKGGNAMRKFLLMFLVVVFFAANCSLALANEGKKKSPGPAPNSGDGVSDGSGF